MAVTYPVMAGVDRSSTAWPLAATEAVGDMADGGRAAGREGSRARRRPCQRHTGTVDHVPALRATRWVTHEPLPLQRHERHPFEDVDGLELPNLAAVRTETIGFARDLVRMASHPQEWSDWMAAPPPRRRSGLQRLNSRVIHSPPRHAGRPGHRSGPPAPGGRPVSPASWPYVPSGAIQRPARATR